MNTDIQKVVIDTITRSLQMNGSVRGELIRLIGDQMPKIRKEVGEYIIRQMCMGEAHKALKNVVEEVVREQVVIKVGVNLKEKK